MLDAMAPGAAVFEPEEVDVLTAACGMAMRKVGRFAPDDPDARLEVAKLVHNLGRSRLKHRKKLKDATDAVALAEEAADLLGYLRGTTSDVTPGDGTKASTRAVPIFPAALRVPPSTLLKPPRLPEVAARPAASAGKTARRALGSLKARA